METKLRPARAVKPGDILREELEARSWTQKAFAEVIGRPAQMVNEIIAGKKSITPEAAVLFSAALGTSPELWLNLESSYRLKLLEADAETAEVARRAELLSAVCDRQHRTTRRGNKRVPFHLDVLVEKQGDQYIAHCLQLDLVTAAANEKSAVDDLLDAVQVQLDCAREDDSMDSAFKPAPSELWLKLWRSRESENVTCRTRRVGCSANIEAVICST